jgi:hypothetical protein
MFGSDGGDGKLEKQGEATGFNMYACAYTYRHICTVALNPCIFYVSISWDEDEGTGGCVECFLSRTACAG